MAACVAVHAPSLQEILQGQVSRSSRSMTCEGPGLLTSRDGDAASTSRE